MLFCMDYARQMIKKSFANFKNTFLKFFIVSEMLTRIDVEDKTRDDVEFPQLCSV